MTDDIEAALATRRVSVARTSPAPGSLANMVNNLQPLVDAVGAAVADTGGTFQLRINEASPDELEQINRLRFVLDQLIVPLQIRRKALDNAAKIAYAQTDASQFPMHGGRMIELSKPDQPYIIESEQLRVALLALVPEGTITTEEVKKAFVEQTTYKPDNRWLNYLRDHRGEKVAAAISKFRRKQPLDPSRMRVTWPDPED